MPSNPPSFFLNIIIGVLLFTTNSVLLGGAIAGFSIMSLDPTINQFVLGIGWLHLYMVIPIAIYVMVFTRFNNPFKRVPKIEIG